MEAQVVHVKLKEGSHKNLDSIIEKWIKEVGIPSSGCTQIITCYETDGRDRCSVIVLFENKLALDTFSDNPNSLDLFEGAKAFFRDSVYFYPAKAQVFNLV